MECVTRGSRWSENSTLASAKAGKAAEVWLGVAVANLGLARAEWPKVLPVTLLLTSCRTCLWNEYLGRPLDSSSRVLSFQVCLTIVSCGLRIWWFVSQPCRGRLNTLFT